MSAASAASHSIVRASSGSAGAGALPASIAGAASQSMASGKLSAASHSISRACGAATLVRPASWSILTEPCDGPAGISSSRRGTQLGHGAQAQGTRKYC